MNNIETKENSGLGFNLSFFGTLLILLWLGSFKFTPTEAEGIKVLIINHPLTFWVYDYFSVQEVSNFVGVSELVIALLLIVGLKYKKVFQLAGIGLTGMMLMTLSYLFTTPGIFQVKDGILVTEFFMLKDIMYLGFALTLLSRQPIEFINWNISPKIGYYVSFFGTALILLWLGIFKFTPTEANAIKPLIINHPLTFWVYDHFSVQAVSDFMGAFELTVVALMLIGLKYGKVNVLAGVGLIAIFLMTVSYIFTTPNSFQVVDGMLATNFSRVKDIMYLAFGITLLSKSLQSLKK